MERRFHPGTLVLLAVVANLVLSNATTTDASEAANQVANPSTSAAPAIRPSQLLGVCDSAALSCLGRVLVYDNNTTFQLATTALDWCAIPYTKAVAADFVTLLSGGGWDLVVMDLPSTEPTDATWPDALASHINGGGKAIHTHWSSTSLTATLQAAYEISAGAGHDTLTFYEWPGCNRLFTVPHPVSPVFDVWSDTWGTNGFKLTAQGSAIEAAGFTSSPTVGEAAIVIGNAGRTIFNGFLFDDFQPADIDSDLDLDMVELIVNELASFCAGPTCCGDLILDPGEDCDSGGTDTPTCDSDCSFPSCGDRHRNAPAGEACDGGGIDTATCDADCTLPACGDSHPNLPAGEACDMGGIDTATCDADCTLPACGDSHPNLPAGEACDMGGVDTPTCDADCTLPSCGDGHPNVPAGEACDMGGVDTPTCDADCTLPACGDSHPNVPAGEACDEGGVDTATCDADCSLPACGDSHPNVPAGEACDMGGVDTATCDADCTLPACGDRHVNVPAGEACDEGGIDTATCDADCTLPVCGDSHTNVPAGEECDDGGTMPGDGCDAMCKSEGCVQGSLSRLTLLTAVKASPGARFYWTASSPPAAAHVNQVAAKGNIAMAWRAPKGPATAACEAPTGILECLDPTPLPATPATFYLQVVGACGSSGDDEGPI